MVCCSLGCWRWSHTLHWSSRQSRRWCFCCREVSSMRICCFIATDSDNLRSDGTSALHWAAHRGHAACIQALLANRADVNVVDRCITPLSYFYAHSRRCHVCVFSHDSDLYRRNGRTPLHHAVTRLCPSKYSGSEPIPIAEFTDIRFDLKHDTRETKTLNQGFDGIIACVHELIKARADVNIRDRCRAYARASCLLRCRRFFAHFCRSEGHTPLLCACNITHQGLDHPLLFRDVTFRCLVLHGADVNICNRCVMSFSFWTQNERS